MGLTDPSSSSLQGSTGLAGKNGTDGQKVEGTLGCILGWEDGPCGCTSPVGTSRTPQLSSPSLGLGLRAHQPLATLVAWAAPVCTCPGDAGPTRTLQGQERTLASESQGPALQEPPAGPGDPQTQPTGHSQTHIHTHITREYRSHVHTDHTCTHHTYSPIATSTRHMFTHITRRAPHVHAHHTRTHRTHAHVTRAHVAGTLWAPLLPAAARDSVTPTEMPPRWRSH